MDTTQVKSWLAEVRGAGNDIRTAASVAQDIQKRMKPGRLHLAASECRMACISAVSWATEPHVIAALMAIRCLRAELEELESVLDERLRRAAPPPGANPTALPVSR